MESADAYPFRTLNTPVRFSVAIAAVAAVFLLDRTFDWLVDEGAILLMLGIAVMASAWFTGTGPALAATLAGTLLAARQVPVHDPAAYARLALFVIQGTVLTAIVSELRRALRQAELDARDAERARRESESVGRLKDEFLATVSHELRTPLNAVLGWVHLLRAGKLDQQTAARGLESIERNARLQSQLTGNLLDISMALTGRLQVESRPVSLVEVVRQSVAAAMPAARAKGVELDHDLEAEAIVVLGDRGRLRQIIWHLLANALKFTPRGGTISVAVRTAGQDAVLEVTDSGSGIDPSFLPRVFDRFTQADSSPTRTAGGLGVGLSLVRELVELHGGQISAANRADGRGAVFAARFPLQPAGPSAAPGVALEAAPAGTPPLDGLRVLVLDRDRECRELVETVLRQRGAAVQTAGTVAEALESLERWRPDVLVSDTGSPDRTSYSVVGKVRSLEADRGGRIPALALTNLAQTDEHVRGLLAAALCDLPKPVEPALLAAEIARLGGRERRRVAR